jgi:shikimate 5-dehydrogenase
MPRLLSANVGLPRDVTWNGKTVHTAIWKSPVEGRRMVRKLNIVGDAQGDLAGHGGEQRAVFVYQMDEKSLRETVVVQSIRKRAKRAITASPRTRRFARLAQILHLRKERLFRMTIQTVPAKPEESNHAF